MIQAQNMWSNTWQNLRKYIKTRVIAGYFNTPFSETAKSSWTKISQYIKVQKSEIYNIKLGDRYLLSELSPSEYCSKDLQKCVPKIHYQMKDPL